MGFEKIKTGELKNDLVAIEHYLIRAGTSFEYPRILWLEPLVGFFRISHCGITWMEMEELDAIWMWQMVNQQDMICIEDSCGNFIIRGVMDKQIFD